MSSVVDARAERPVRTSRTLPRRILYIAWRVISMEIGVWQSLYRVIFRRPRVPSGAAAFSYDKPIRMVLITFLVASAIEVPIVDLVVHQWPVVRIPLLVFGIWGVTFMLGLFLGYLTRPHAVGPLGIRMRHGAEVDVDLPWDLVRSVAPKRRAVTANQTFTVIGRGEEQVLNHSVQNATQIDVELERPTDIRLPSGTVRVREIRLSVDDPTAFLEAVRTHMP